MDSLNHQIVHPKNSSASGFNAASDVATIYRDDFKMSRSKLVHRHPLRSPGRRARYAPFQLKNRHGSWTSAAGSRRFAGYSAARQELHLLIEDLCAEMSVEKARLETTLILKSAIGASMSLKNKTNEDDDALSTTSSDDSLAGFYSDDEEEDGAQQQSIGKVVLPIGVQKSVEVQKPIEDGGRRSVDSGIGNDSLIGTNDEIMMGTPQGSPPSMINSSPNYSVSNNNLNSAISDKKQLANSHVSKSAPVRSGFCAPMDEDYENMINNHAHKIGASYHQEYSFQDQWVNGHGSPGQNQISDNRNSEMLVNAPVLFVPSEFLHMQEPIPIQVAYIDYNNADSPLKYVDCMFLYQQTKHILNGPIQR